MGGIGHNGAIGGCGRRAVISALLVSAALITAAIWASGCTFVTRSDDCSCPETPPCVCDPDEICTPCPCDDPPPPPPDWAALITGDWSLWEWLEGNDNIKSYITFGADGEMYRVDFQKVDDFWAGTSERWWSWRVEGDSLILSRVDDGYERELRMSFTVSDDTLVTTTCYSARECYEDGFNRGDVAGFRSGVGKSYLSDPALYTTMWRMTTEDGADESIEFYGPHAYIDQDPPRYFSGEDYTYVWYTEESNLFIIGAIPSNCKTGINDNNEEYEYDCVLTASETAVFDYATAPRETLTLSSAERGIDDTWHFDAEHYSVQSLSKKRHVPWNP